MVNSQGFSQKQLKQLKILFTEQKEYTDQKFDYTDKRFNGLDKRFNDFKIYTDKNFGETQQQIKKLAKLIRETRKDLVDRITNLAVTTSTRKEFEELKTKVDYYHPTI